VSETSAWANFNPLVLADVDDHHERGGLVRSFAIDDAHLSGALFAPPGYLDLRDLADGKGEAEDGAPSLRNRNS
jgi:hypothetical protein